MLRTSGLDEVTSRADIVRLEQCVVIGVVVKSSLMGRRRNVMATILGAEICEDVRCRQKKRDWENKSCGEFGNGV
jgi:hypothetical protein